MTHSRRKAREAALQALYWTETSGDPVRQTLHTMAIRANLSPEAARFAEALGRRAWERREALDRRIAGVSENWSIERISRVDRILLRMALTEMSDFPDIPAKVSIDEAVELAKRFGVEKAPGFVNGVLDRLAREGSEERAEVPGAAADGGP